MQSMNTRSTRGIEHGIIPGWHQPDFDGTDIGALWDKVYSGDMTALQAVHEILYPALFKYMYAIVRNDEVADEIIADAFIHCWRRRSAIAWERMITELVKRMRMTVNSCLSTLPADKKYEVGCASSGIHDTAILLLEYNSLKFKKVEIKFFREYLKLDCIAISEILAC